MFIIRLLFYLVDGMMDSSFLTLQTAVSVGLALFSGILFLRMMIQFGLPNHPSRFTAYLVTFCAVFFFGAKALAGLNLISPWFWMRWRTLPLVAGSLALLLQSIMTIGQFSLIQQKVVSRLPLIAALLFLAFFPSYADFFFGMAIFAASAFLSISVGKARYQKRLFLKMAFFLGIFGLLQLPQYLWMYLLGEVFLFFALFYFFLFEQTFGISARMDEFQESLEGAAR